VADGLRDLASSFRRRERGSGNLRAGWLDWRTKALGAMRTDLSTSLPAPPDDGRFEELHRALGVASDEGCVVADGGGLFGDPGARSGYALGFLHARATNLADLLFDAWNGGGGGDDGGGGLPDFWTEGSNREESPMPGGAGGRTGGDDAVGRGGLLRSSPPPSSSSYSVVSLGGGPGFDYVGIALAASFCSQCRRSSSSGGGGGASPRPDGMPTTITVAILDIEEGWRDVVGAVGESARRVLGGGPDDAATVASSTRVVWGGRCDIARSLYDPINSDCLDLVGDARLYAIQYCVGENASLIRASDHAFFRELFDASMPGSAFVFTEAHPRAWPDFYRLVESLGCSHRMHIGFHKNGRRMLLRKEGRHATTTDYCGINDDGAGREGRTTIINERDRELVRKFEEIGRSHERNMSSGYSRQVPKRLITPPPSLSVER
jgi:hypothetical protein